MAMLFRRGNEQVTIIQSLIGGILIGLASAVLYTCAGRIAGISGILGKMLPPGDKSESGWRALFLFGLVVGGFVMVNIAPEKFAVVIGEPSTMRIIAAGLLVGFGTRLANGCTSGHGVCGISRFSFRSIVATIIFMMFGIATVFIVRLAELGKSLEAF